MQRGLNLIVIFAFADLLKGSFVKGLGVLMPTYWISEIVRDPNQISLFLYAAGSAVAWLLVIALVGKWKWND